MNLLRYIFINIVSTLLLRFFPFPDKTGLIRIGKPDRNSPVLLTGNYRLTVERVKMALRKMDIYLLIANSRGVNVWCGATGGLFTNHDVISTLKTTGIEEFVNHRKVILPQLSAPGIEAKIILQKTGWEVIWGPVYAGDIPDFIKSNLKKSPEMREVKFTWIQRLEMAIAWAFLISVISAFLMSILWRPAIPALIPLIWGLSFLIYLSFPLYNSWLASEGERIRIGFISFDLKHGVLSLLLWIILSFAIVSYNFFVDTLILQHILGWEIISLVVISVLIFDLIGSTPVYKGGEKERGMAITVNESKCKGAGFCEQVCPRNCHEITGGKQTTISRADKCVKCGACIVQCPFDALYFTNPAGRILSPEIIRRFKLNLKGNRVVKVGL